MLVTDSGSRRVLMLAYASVAVVPKRYCDALDVVFLWDPNHSPILRSRFSLTKDCASLPVRFQLKIRVSQHHVKYGGKLAQTMSPFNTSDLGTPISTISSPSAPSNSRCVISSSRQSFPWPMCRFRCQSSPSLNSHLRPRMGFSLASATPLGVYALIRQSLFNSE